MTTPQARRSTSTVLNSPPAPRQRALSMAFESAADEALAPPALGASEAASRLQAIARGRIVRSSLLAPLELDCSVVPSWFFGVEPRVAAAVRLQAAGRRMIAAEVVAIRRWRRQLDADKARLATRRLIEANLDMGRARYEAAREEEAVDEQARQAALVVTRSLATVAEERRRRRLAAMI